MWELAVKIAAAVSIVCFLLIFVFVTVRAWPVLSASGIGLFTRNTFDAQMHAATSDPSGAHANYQYGLLGPLMGTFLSTGIALVFATVFGVGGAVVIAEFLPRPLASACKAIVRLLASIPSVIFGLMGLIAVVPFILDNLVTPELQSRYINEFQMTGDSFLACVIVLTFMIVPTLISLAVDAIEAVPAHLRESGFSFGMSHMRVIIKIVLPAARSGIIAGVILAAGRGVGEAIAVSMVCGGVANIPNFAGNPLVALLTPILPLSAAIVNYKEGMSIASSREALYACAFVLFVLGASLSLSAAAVEKRIRRSVGLA